MSAVADVPRPGREPRPTFAGCLWGELLKLRAQGLVWTMLGLAILFFAVLSAAVFQASGLRTLLDQSTRLYLFRLYDIYLSIFDVGSGIFLLIASARLVGMEYSGGTIRVLLSRGAGRLRLFLAKLAALGLCGLALLAGFAIMAGASVCGSLLAWKGSLQPLTALPGQVWTDLGINLVVALTSIGVCILIGAAAATLGRSLAFGIGAAMAFFPIDNFGTQILALLHVLTGWGIWTDVTAYLLGPNLNVLPTLLQTDHRARAAFAFAVPQVHVDATHVWLVIAAWALAMLAGSMVLIRRRDVL